MNDFLRFAFGQRATPVWLVLVAATAVSWGTASATAAQSGHTRLLSTLVVGIALLKARLVIRYFMEVRGAARGLQLATDCWCVGVGAAVLALYWGVFPR